MTRLELLVAVCALSCAQPGYVEPAATVAAAEPSPFEGLIPLQRYSLHVAAAAATLLALLLDDGRPRALSGHRPNRAHNQLGSC